MISLSNMKIIILDNRRIIKFENVKKHLSFQIIGIMISLSNLIIILFIYLLYSLYIIDKLCSSALHNFA